MQKNTEVDHPTVTSKFDGMYSEAFRNAVTNPNLNRIISFNIMLQCAAIAMLSIDTMVYEIYVVVPALIMSHYLLDRDHSFVKCGASFAYNCVVVCGIPMMIIYANETGCTWLLIVSLLLLAFVDLYMILVMCVALFANRPLVSACVFYSMGHYLQTYNRNLSHPENHLNDVIDKDLLKLIVTCVDDTYGDE